MLMILLLGGFLRKVGTKLPNGEFTGSFGKILKLGGLPIKVLIKTGDTDQSQKDLISDKVLGYGWDSSTDMIFVSTITLFMCSNFKPLASSSMII